MEQKLFWCSTPCGDEDYFVVAPSTALAVAFFSQEHGFELDVIHAEELLIVPHEDRVKGSDFPGVPRVETLAKWGLHYNKNFHVFYDARGRIFRPEGVVRAHMRARSRGLRKTS